MATDLQQGSAERVAFLKEVDQNLADQAEQMEKALTAPSAEDSWRLWIQAIVRAGKRFFSHTKALHTTEETRQANRERWAFFEIDKRCVSVWEKRLHRWILRGRKCGRRCTFEFGNWEGN